MTSIRFLLAPPVFADDEEKTRVASVLHSLLLALVAAAGVYAALAAIVAAISTRGVLIAGLAVLAMLGLLLVVHRGYVRFAGAALSAGFLAVTTGAVVIGGGVSAPIFGAYALIVLTSAVLLGWRA